MLRREDDFQAFFIRDFGDACFEGLLYAKITKIAGEPIQPEIDLLDIMGMEPTPNLRAFEFKILHGKNESNNYKGVYAGLGQALSYFKYGIDQSFLIIGISADVPQLQTEKVKAIIANVGETFSQITENRFQIRMYREEIDEVTDFPAIPPSGKYTSREYPKGFHDYIELSRNNLLALHFPMTKSKNFFKKHQIDSVHIP